MSKKNRKDKDVCLHCAFIDAHKTKWPNWKKDDSGEAFQDFVSSAGQIAAEAMSMLGPRDQMKFIRRVFLGAVRLQGGGQDTSLADAIEVLRAELSTKH